MWHFGKHGEFLHGTRLPDPGPEGLRKYDNGGYKLLDSIYSGLIQPKIQGRASIPLQKGAVSGNSTEKTEFTVKNSRTTIIKLFWVDTKGNEKLYATIPPKGHVVKQTYVSSVWMFQDDKSQPIMYLRVNDPPCDIELKDPN